MNYTIFVPLAMAGIVPFGLLMDALLPRHRAVLVTLMAGFLFLPSAQYELGGVLNWNNTTAPALVVLLGVFMRDQALLMRFRPRWWDLPMLAWCISPGLASLSNGFPIYDAASVVLYQTLWVGVPYFVGRLHIRSREHLLDLAKILVVGCLIYVPLCAYEIRMSPTLHLRLYGFMQHSFLQTVRGSYYRPMVFLQHGLMAAMWMGMGAFLAGVLAIVRPDLRLFRLPIALLAAGLTLTTIAMQSLGAVVLLAAAWAALAWARRGRSQAPLLLLTFFPMLWCALRITGVLPAEAIVEVAAQVSAERAESLDFRLQTEDAVFEHALQKPLFGWSAWDRNRTVELDYTERSLVLDGHWIINLSARGFFGLIALLLVYLVPLSITFRRVRASGWRTDPGAQLLGGLGIVAAMTMVDNLFNSMINPMFILLLGALPTAALAWRGVAESESSDGATLAHADVSSTPRVLGG